MECGIWNDLQKTKQIFKEANNVRDHEKVMKVCRLQRQYIFIKYVKYIKIMLIYKVSQKKFYIYKYDLKKT